ncbi:lysosome-associated membrane glycoprotein 3 [Denticeps clupeoides]|uniref:lysosome-associated membrane glycoprotein 3 n=1 Tax=Denticeps clupeoides TaxID=299321 RepID=UPI0010A30257|nr:lysosome-associated membrane glycoprotein 3 [Denticeps clupeoides]
MTKGLKKVNYLMAWCLLSCILFTASASAGSTFTSDEVPLPDATGSPPYNQLSTMHKPALQSTASRPISGIYSLRNHQGKVCIRAVMGVQYMVKEHKKYFYFNMNPKDTIVTGYCGIQHSLMSLDFDGGNLEFTFLKEANTSYVTKMRANLDTAPTCTKCKSKSYPGLLDHENLFKSKAGLYFACKSDLEFQMSPDLRVMIASVQLQPFDLVNGQFGKEFECWEDYINRIVPIIVGAIAVGFCLIAIISCLVVREHRNRQYERLQ